MEKEIARLNAEAIETKRRLDKMEDTGERHKEDIRTLYGHHEGTKAYVTQILQKLDHLETKMFNLITSMNAAAAEERKAAAEASAQRATAAANERTSTTSGWQNTIKDVIKLTVAAAIGYILSQGGTTP